MNWIDEGLDYLRHFFKRKLIGYTKNQYMIIMMVLSLFLPYTIGLTILVLGLIYLLITKQLKDALTTPLIKNYAFLFSIYSLLVSLFHKNLLGAGQSLGMIVVVLFTAFYRKNVNDRLFTFIIDLCCLLSIACFLYGLLEYAHIVDRLGYEFSDFEIFDAPKDRVNSTFFNANYYAQIIQFIILMCVYKILNTRKWHRIVYYAATIFCNLFALYLTGCRTAWLSFVFTIPFMFYVNNYKKTFYCIVSAMAIVGCALLIKPDLFPRFDSILSSFATRVKIWSTGIEGIKENPIFGLGPGGYKLIYKQFAGHPTNHSHNIFIELVLSFGIVGVLIACRFVVPIVKETISIIKNKIDMKLAGLIICFIITVFTHNFFNYSIFWSQTGILFIIVLNSTVIYKEENKTVEMSS